MYMECNSPNANNYNMDHKDRIIHCINMLEKDGVKQLVKSLFFLFCKRDYNLCITARLYKDIS